MKILVLAPHPFFQYRGTPIAVKLLCQILSGQGHRITLLSFHEGQPVDIPNVVHHRLPALPGISGIRPGFSWKKLVCDVVMFLKGCLLLKQARPDVVHAIEEAAFIAAGFRCLFGVPYIYDMDSSLSQQLADQMPILMSVLRPVSEWLERIVIHGSLGVVAVCRSLEDTVHRLDRRKQVLRLEDISLLAECTDPAENLGASLGLKGPVIMYIGNLERYQGVDLLLEGVARAVAEVPALELVVVGGSAEGIAHYRRKALKLGIGSRTHFIGQRPITQLDSLLHQADVLVSPRISGTNTPMKVYSYLASGKPVLATRLYTHTQVLDDQVAELVAPEPVAMARGIIRLLQNRDYAEGLGRKGLELANAEYSYPQYKAKLDRFYEAVGDALRTSSAMNYRIGPPLAGAR